MIVFDRDTHTYWKDGERIPSVTQILQVLNADKYDGVPERVLKKKADYGTRVHEWVERYVMTGAKGRVSDTMKITTDQVKKLVDRERLIIHSVEQIVATERYAGTYDMYGTWKGIPTLFDIKTTAELNERYLSAQLGMYKLASGLEVQKCACMWLPKFGLAKLVEIQPIDEEQIDWMVWRYEQEHSTD